MTESMAQHANTTHAITTALGMESVSTELALASTVSKDFCASKRFKTRLVHALIDATQCAHTVVNRSLRTVERIWDSAILVAREHVWSDASRVTTSQQRPLPTAIVKFANGLVKPGDCPTLNSPQSLPKFQCTKAMPECQANCSRSHPISTETRITFFHTFPKNKTLLDFSHTTVMLTISSVTMKILMSWIPRNTDQTIRRMDQHLLQ